MCLNFAFIWTVKIINNSEAVILTVALLALVSIIYTASQLFLIFNSQINENLRHLGTVTIVGGKYWKTTLQIGSSFRSPKGQKCMKNEYFVHDM